VWRCLRRLGLTPSEADDATQQAFLVFSQRLPQVRAGSERAFLYSVATRIASDLRRRAGRRYEVADAKDHAALGTQPDDLLEERQVLSLLDRVLDTLASDLRQAFVLYEIEELSMKEIASILDIPLGTVASRLRRAREEFQRASAQYRKGQTR
jgi:RNA polymerase sigma-70 factor (ECF subfamily)